MPHSGAASYVGDYEGEHCQCRDREDATGTDERYGSGNKDVCQPLNWNNPQSIIQALFIKYHRCYSQRRETNNDTCHETVADVV